MWAFVVEDYFVLAEFKKQIAADATFDKNKKPLISRPLLGDIMKEANANGKYYMGR